MKQTILIAVACVGVSLASPVLAGVTLTHVHGLAYSADGEKLMVPSHHGLAVYEKGRWHIAPGAKHDYMGFSATRERLYSSGHPAPGSGQLNPFGLIRSRDGGKTWDRLGLEGETDFHLLATGWNSNTVYVWNPAPNSRMKRAGLHGTRNDGFAWTPAAAQGLDGPPRALAVHPDDPAVVAVATPAGVFLSTDSGMSFRAVATDGQGTAVFFDLDGKRLWFGMHSGQARLATVALSGAAPADVKLPVLERDAVAYVAQHPRLRSTYAVATYGRNLYLTTDGGQTWASIAEAGAGKDAK